MKDLIKYPIALTIMLYLSFSIGTNSFYYTEWTDVARVTFAYIFFCIWTITLGANLLKKFS